MAASTRSLSDTDEGISHVGNPRMWATISRAVHPTQGDGLAHRSGTTPAISASNASARLRNLSAVSVTGSSIATCVEDVKQSRAAGSSSRVASEDGVAEGEAPPLERLFHDHPRRRAVAHDIRQRAPGRGPGRHPLPQGRPQGERRRQLPRDPIRSRGQRTVFAHGLNLAVLTLRIQPRWGSEPIGLPINMRRYSKRDRPLPPRVAARMIGKATLQTYLLQPWDQGAPV
jgi:hypothetical protein